MMVHESENRWMIEMQDCLVMEDVCDNHERYFESICDSIPWSSPFGKMTTVFVPND